MPRDPNRPRRAYNTSLSPEERSEAARLAANARWAKAPDRTGGTRAARAARLAGYYAEADRLGITDPDLREKMALNAQAADMARMRLIQARRRRLAAAAGEAAEQAGEAAEQAGEAS